MERSDRREVIRRQGKRLVVWLVVALLAAGAIGIGYVDTPYHGSPESLAAVDADPKVTVDRTNGGYVLEPVDTTPEAGLVFYPGGRVHPDAYVESLAPLAREANVTVVIPRMPLHLAIVDYGLAQNSLGDHAADTAIAAHPEIDQWFVGGHSLGGAMACRYAATNPEADGLLLYASYCDVDISDRDLAVLSVTGSADTVLNQEAYERNRENLPTTVRIESLDGVNHTQFGSYRGQDEPSGTSYETAHARLTEVVVPWLDGQVNRTDE